MVLYKPDITVIFEGNYEDLPQRDELHTHLTATRNHRDDYAMLIHNVARDAGPVGLRKIIERVRRDVEWLYVTDLTDKTGYGSFWEDWLDVTW
ncbi:hypothetical protein GQ44DRAFT_707982 [Phaeosphaeriaceae sp. PMI808]|nr:hypothetical protein GQ44DRAFT_707982 [Phaeosphaeriaceae sp. PMI808]